jgi:hypothetical protein
MRKTGLFLLLRRYPSSVPAGISRWLKPNGNEKELISPLIKINGNKEELG